MFSKLHRNIYLNLFVIPTAFVVILSSLTFFFINDYLENDYRNAAAESVSQTSTNFNFYMDILASDLRLLADDPAVLTYATTGTSPVAAQNKLNAAVNSDGAILGATLYGLASDIHIASSGVSGYASLLQLEEDSAVSGFLADPETAAELMLRNTLIPDNFAFVSYDESYGILSYFLKVYDGSDVRGLLVADLDTGYLYDTFFDYGAYPAFTGVTSLIADDAIYLKDAANLAYGAWVLEAPTATLQNVSLSASYLNTSLAGHFRLITVFNDKGHQQTRLWLALSVSAMATLLIVGAYLVTVKTARHIMGPLNDIVEKMKKQSAD